MKNIALLAIMFLPLFGWGQKMEKPIKDKLTGEETNVTTLEAVYRKFGVGHATDLLEVNCTKNKDGYKINFFGRLANYEGGKFRIGDKLYVKQEKGGIDTLNYLVAQNPLYNSSLHSSEFVIICSIDETFLKKVEGKKITFLRFTNSGLSLDYEIKDKLSEVITKSVELIFKP